MKEKYQHAQHTQKHKAQQRQVGNIEKLYGLETEKKACLPPAYCTQTKIIISQKQTHPNQYTTNAVPIHHISHQSPSPALRRPPPTLSSSLFTRSVVSALAPAASSFSTIFVIPFSLAHISAVRLFSP